MSRKHIIQLVSFQLIWFSTVLGRNEWLAVSLFLLALHFTFSPERRADAIVLILALPGIVIDGCLWASGVFEFTAFPFWLVVLWLAFVLNLGHSLIYLRRLAPVFLILLTGISGGYAYILAWKLGAVELPLGWLQSGVLVALVWAVLVPVLVKADLRLRAWSGAQVIAKG